MINFHVVLGCLATMLAGKKKGIRYSICYRFVNFDTKKVFTV